MTVQDIGHQAMKEHDLWDTGESMRSILRQWKLVSLLPGKFLGHGSKKGDADGALWFSSEGMKPVSGEEQAARALQRKLQGRANSEWIFS